MKIKYYMTMKNLIEKRVENFEDRKSVIKLFNVNQIVNIKFDESVNSL